MRYPSQNFDVTDIEREAALNNELATTRAELERVEHVAQTALRQRRDSFRLGYQTAVEDAAEACDFEHEDTITDGIPVVVDQD